MNHVQVSGLPVLILPRTLRLAIAVNADSLIPLIVARQLEHAQGPLARAAVLDSTVQLLMTNHWVQVPYSANLTLAHVQLARSYIPQIDALGAVALHARITARQALLSPVHDAHKIEEEFTLQRELQQLLQRVPLDSIAKEDNLYFYTMRHLVESELAALTYLTTLKDSDLQAYETVVNQPNGYHGLVGKPAPPVICDYWYDGRTAAMSRASSPVAPASGRISVVVFDGRPSGDHRLPEELRRVHKVFPDVAITVVAHTEGFAGTHVLADPEQEGALLHQVYTDSLGYPGDVCVLAGQPSTVQDGHVITLPTAVESSYQVLTFGPMFIVDQRGIIVADGMNNFIPYEDTLFDFIRRLHGKAP